MDAPRGRVVDVVLKNAGVHHRDGSKHEAHEDPRHWIKVDFVLAEKRVDDDCGVG